jgi:type IV pilus assembly protein PilB
VRLKKLGELLVQLGILDRTQLNRALQVQKEQAPEERHPIGRICVDLGFLTRDRLGRILDRWGKRLRLGELLIHRGRIAPTQLDAALKVQQRTGGRLGEILIQMGVITEANLTEALAEQYDLVYIPLENFSVTGDLSRYVNAQYAWRHGVVPIARAGRRLTVALYDPRRSEVIRDLERATGHQIQPVLASATEVYGLAKRLYEELPEKEREEEEVNRACDAAPKERDETPTETVCRMITEADALQVRDLYLESDAQGTEVRVSAAETFGTAAGNPFLFDPLPGSLRVIKTIARLDVAESLRPQEGFFTIEVGEEPAKRTVRVHARLGRAKLGECARIRIEDREESRPSFEEIGLEATIGQQCTAALTNRKGTFLVAGPTGSRKRLTVRAALGPQHLSGKKTVTVEDAILYQLPGVYQRQVDPEEAASYTQLLDALGRDCPDLILVDRIGDRETARRLFPNERPGWLCLSTLAVGNATGVVLRLRSLGVEPSILTKSLVGVLAQRLLRRNCPSCEEVYEPRSSVLREWFRRDTPFSSWKRGAGCDQCHGTGYLGNILVTELWLPSSEERKAIAEGLEGPSLRQLTLRRMRCFGQVALEEAIAGRTTLEEGLRVLAYDDIVHTRLNGLEREKAGRQATEFGRAA